MAIGIQSIVALKNTSSALAATSGVMVSNPPIFGKVASGAGPYVVDWGNNVQTASILAAQLDEILDAAAGSLALKGFTVRVAGKSAGAAINVVMVYKRNATDMVAGPLLGTDVWVELPASAVAVVS